MLQQANGSKETDYRSIKRPSRPCYHSAAEGTEIHITTTTKASTKQNKLKHITTEASSIRIQSSIIPFLSVVSSFSSYTPLQLPRLPPTQEAIPPYTQKTGPQPLGQYYFLHIHLPSSILSTQQTDRQDTTICACLYRKPHTTPPNATKRTPSKSKNPKQKHPLFSQHNNQQKKTNRPGRTSRQQPSPKHPSTKTKPKNSQSKNQNNSRYAVGGGWGWGVADHAKDP
jgi:hypothetical protein